MKNKHIYITAFFLLLFTASEVSVYAGHGEHQRNKCRWWANRFRANSHLWFPCIVPICYHHGVSCDYANSSCSAAGFGCTATSSSHAGWDGCWGSQNGCGGVCAGEASDLMLEFGEGLEQKNAGNGEYYAATQSNRFSSSFAGDYAIIQRLQLSLSSDIADPNVNTYKLTVWLPKDDTLKGIEDTTITAAKTVQYGLVKIVSGVVTFEGTLFSSKDFKVTRTGTTISLSYIGGDKKILIPGLEKIDAVISSEGDVIKDGTQVGKAVIAQTDKKLTEAGASVNVFPNPAFDVVNVENNIPAFTPTVVKIFNQDGRVVSEMALKAAMRKSALITVPVKELEKGNYFIMLSDGKDKYLKKFLKQ